MKRKEIKTNNLSKPFLLGFDSDEDMQDSLVKFSLKMPQKIKMEGVPPQSRMIFDCDGGLIQEAEVSLAPKSESPPPFEEDINFPSMRQQAQKEQNLAM